jgi:hypothetical protein
MGRQIHSIWFYRHRKHFIQDICNNPSFTVNNVYKKKSQKEIGSRPAKYHGANPGKLNWISVLFRDNDHNKTNVIWRETSVSGFGPSNEAAIHLGVDLIKNSRSTLFIQGRMRIQNIRKYIFKSC